MPETWLQKLKVGDTVLWGNHEVLATVQKVSNAFVWVQGDKFRRSDGSRVRRDRWFQYSIQEPTPEALERIKQKKEADGLLNEILLTRRWNYLPIDKLRRIVAILREDTDEPK